MFPNKAYRVKDIEKGMDILLVGQDWGKLELWLISNPFVTSIDGGVDFETLEKKYENSHRNDGDE